jgi:hypothetical protein
MPHIIERATSARSKCRGCGARIAAGEQRLGERLPNPFADDDSEMTHWYHVACAAFKRPEPFLDALSATTDPVDDRERLEHEARLGVAHRRLPRVHTAERAPSGRATCRACREVIAKDSWRISLVYYEDGRFQPSGSIHARCAKAYFETDEVMARITHFSPALAETDIAAIQAEIATAGPEDKSGHGGRET